jgi:DNA polymerase-1
MLSVDFSQLEPRIVTALSQDPKLLEVYRSGKDLYVDVAENLGVTRTAAKTITLGILYGMMGQRLFEQLQLNGCTQGNPPMPIYDLDACEKLIDAWFDAYPKVKMLVGTTVAAAKMCGGKAMTIGGRGRMLPGLFLDGWGWPNEKLRQEAERQAFNHLIQGTGMEVLRRGMLEVDESFRTVHMLLAIHDELVMEVEDAHAETLAPQIANSMVQRMEGVELKTTYCLGDSWGELKG